MGVSFWLSLESYTGFRNQPLWSPPNLDHTPLTGPHRGVSQIIGEICLTMGGFDPVDGFGLT